MHLALRTPTKCSLDLLPRPSLPPNILTIRATLYPLLLLAIPILNHPLLDILAAITILGAHAEPKIVPVVGATAQLSVPVYVVEVAAQRGAVEGAVEGCAAGH